MESHVVDGDTGVVERAHDGGGQPVTAHDRGPQATTVVADLNRTGDVRLERDDSRTSPPRRSAPCCARRWATS